MMRSGRFRHRFDLLKLKVDSNGDPLRNSFGARTEETEVAARPWCNILDVDSSENVGKATDGQETIKFEIRFSKQFLNPDTDMFIKFDGSIYDIVSAKDPYRRRERIHVVAVKRR